jgi:hypothetical protein
MMSFTKFIRSSANMQRISYNKIHIRFIADTTQKIKQIQNKYDRVLLLQSVLNKSLNLGFVTGAWVGAYYGFTESKKDDYLSNVMQTTISSLLGSAVGVISVVLSPFLIPISLCVLMARAYNNEVKRDAKK